MPTIPAGVEVKDLSQAAARPGWGERIRNAAAALQGRPFGPGAPITPIIGTETPRQFSYPPGVNLQRQPRREYAQLTPFEQLRGLAAAYDVAAMCVAARIEEMQGMGWSIAAKDKREQPALQDECDGVAAFFEQPDKLNDYHSWMGMLLYELFTTDALTLFRRKDRGEQLYGLEPVDGSTIKPLLDDRGRTLAYQQVIHGFAESNYRRPEADAPDEQLPIYTPQELIYRPRWTRTFTPYGFPPTEWIILRVNTALRKQAFDLSWFTDGNVPDMIATPPEGLDPQQVRDFEEWFNAVLTGQDAARRKVRFIPWNMSFTMLKEMQYNTVLDEWMLRVTCAAYSVPPQELGFTSDVNRSTAEMQEAVNERRGLKPLANWLKATIFDPVIRNDLGRLWGKPAVISAPGQPTRPASRPSIEWQWHYGDKVDLAVQASGDRQYWSMGVVSEDELRAMRYGDTLDGAAPGPPSGRRKEKPPESAAAPQTAAGYAEQRDQAAERYAAQRDQFAESYAKAARAELRAWREKAIKAVKSGRSAQVEFVSDVIPRDLQRTIQDDLAAAKTPPAVRKIFEAAPEVAAPFFRGAEIGWDDYG